MIPKKVPVEDLFMEALRGHIKKAAEEELKEAKKRMDKRIEEIVASTSLAIAHHMNVKTLGENIEITLRKIENK